MSRSSTTIAITREAHLSAIIQSFSTHFLILFSKFRDSLDVVHIIYYSPIDIEHSRVTNNLRILSICLRRNESVKAKVSTIWHFVRLYSPVLDSNVLSGYLSLNTKTKTFIQILRHQLRHYPVSQSSPTFYLPEPNNRTSVAVVESSVGGGGIIPAGYDPLFHSRFSDFIDKMYYDEGVGVMGSNNSNNSNNSDFITGITITLRGRIQTESIKPRKTVQSFIVGSHYSTRRHSLVSNTSSITNSNYELGSYSITVKVTGITDGLIRLE